MNRKVFCIDCKYIKKANWSKNYFVCKATPSATSPVTKKKTWAVSCSLMNDDCSCYSFKKAFWLKRIWRRLVIR